MRIRIMSDTRRSSCFARRAISLKSSRAIQMLRRTACGLSGRFVFLGRPEGRGGVWVGIRVQF